jgi:predicted O-methyltransferase YrrM
MPIPEVSLPTTECPEPKLWKCFDEQSAEVEVLDFLYSLVRTIKPQLIVETGTHKGLSSCYMGKALRDNGRGKLITCEVEPKLQSYAIDLITKARLVEHVECRLVSSLDLSIEGEIDFLFLDSEPSLRMKELDKFLPQLSPTCLIALHDVNTGWHKELRESILRQDKDRHLSVVLLPTPRGLALCQKREGRE